MPVKEAPRIELRFQHKAMATLEGNVLEQIEYNGHLWARRISVWELIGRHQLELRKISKAVGLYGVGFPSYQWIGGLSKL